MTQPLFANAPSIWPVDAPRAVLIARIWVAGRGPVLVRVQPDGVYDLSALALTSRDLLALPDAAQRVRAHASGDGHGHPPRPRQRPPDALARTV